MSDHLQIELVAPELQAAIDKALAATLQPTELLTAIGGELEKRIQARFESKTDPTGAAWAPHAPRTLKRYAKQGHQPSLLQLTGNMLAGVAYNVIGSQAVEVGFTNTTYAAFHVTGTKHMPRRDALFATVNSSATQGTMGQGDELAVFDAIEDFLRDKLGPMAT